MSNYPLKTIFMGTPDFASPYLQALAKDSNFKIIGVFSNSDKAVGRTSKLSPTPVKQTALELNLPIFQPEKIRTETELIASLKPDLILVVAYGHIIPQSILDIPKYGCINVHGSLLPKYRGASCLQAPILNGDQESGMTIMKMDAGLDTGPIIRQEKITLEKDETTSGLHDKLATLGANMLTDTLKDYVNGKIEAKAQNDQQASYVKILKKSDGLLDLTKSAIEIERMIRALNPWPGTYFSYQNKKGEIDNIKILKVDNIILESNDHPIGHFFIHNKQLALQCGQNALLVLTLQIEGRRAQSAQEFINGYLSQQ